MTLVYDDAEPVVGGDASDGSDDQDMLGGAGDSTKSGSLRATAFGGDSSSNVIIEDYMISDIDLTVAYFPSPCPGGAVEAKLSSIIEFVMLFNDVIWRYFLTIEN